MYINKITVGLNKNIEFLTTSEQCSCHTSCKLTLLSQHVLYPEVYSPWKFNHHNNSSMIQQNQGDRYQLEKLQTFARHVSICITYQKSFFILLRVFFCNHENGLSILSRGILAVSRVQNRNIWFKPTIYQLLSDSQFLLSLMKAVRTYIIDKHSLMPEAQPRTTFCILIFVSVTLEVKCPKYYPPPYHESNSQQIKDTMAKR